ncbi:MAG: methyltransferase domain-containing protein, partial [Lachnospiraceae bacterium]|nr:methyltransferase domain-containing protein [Lachnospiraceae bacterium]
KGWIQVQDVSSGFASEVANPKDGDQILDVCGAPGGKSLHLADLLEQKKGSGRILSRDVSDKKVELIEENRDRCQFQNIETEVFDGREASPEWEEKADLVMADVPCSGLGILARKNDIKYNASKERIEELIPLQRQILKNASKMVKPGGTLLFSTCTVSKEENDGNRQWILEELPFEPEEFYEILEKETNIPDDLEKEARQGYLRLLPGIHGTDGFYIAKFRRI